VTERLPIVLPMLAVPSAPLQADTAFSVAHSLFQGRFWSSSVVPALRAGFGSWWWAVVGAAVLGPLLGSLLWPGIGLVSALLGAVVGLAIFLVLQVLGRGSLGVGDMKLALLIGAMRGFPDVFNALLLGTLLGGLAAAFLLIVMRKGRKASIAYGPYLAAGAILSFFV